MAKLTYAHLSRWSIGHLRPFAIALCSGLLWPFQASWSMSPRWRPFLPRCVFVVVDVFATSLFFTGRNVSLTPNPFILRASWSCLSRLLRHAWQGSGSVLCPTHRAKNGQSAGFINRGHTWRFFFYFLFFFFFFLLTIKFEDRCFTDYRPESLLFKKIFEYLLFMNTTVIRLLIHEDEFDYLNGWIKNGHMRKNLTPNGEPHSYR